MRIKAVLRDTDILKMEPGSTNRIIAAAKKNVDRLISWSSLLKIMGLDFEARTTMLDMLKGSNMHIWLLNDGNQHLIFITQTNSSFTEASAYQWQ